MITFVPCADFEEIARCLDDKRLGAQRYESWLILRWLRDPTSSNKVNAGYCAMWKGYENALVRYVNTMLREWGRRGKNNVTLQPEMPGLEEGDCPVELPPWWGRCETLHSYHRHALVSKNPEHYRQFGWTEDGSPYNGSYMWPVQVQQEDKEEWILRWPQKYNIASVSICEASPDKCFPRKDTIIAKVEKKKSKEKKPARKRTGKTIQDYDLKSPPSKATPTKGKKRSAIVTPDTSAASQKRSRIATSGHNNTIAESKRVVMPPQLTKMTLRNGKYLQYE